MSVFQQFKNDDLTVIISELLIATADSTDPLLDGSINEVLRALRERFNMDVVFVSEFVDGKRVFRFVDTRAFHMPLIKQGECNPLEESFCARIVDKRLPELIRDVGQLPAGAIPPLPFRVGAHLSTPIVLKSGQTFGTLCCFSAAPNEALQNDDLATLRMCANLVARKLELAEAQGIKDPPPLVSAPPVAPDWELEPVNSNYVSKVWMEPVRRSG